MNILENIQVLEEKNFWDSIATADMDEICAAIYNWKKEHNYNTPLLDFFCALQNFHIGEEKIEFYNIDAINLLPQEDFILLFKHRDKIKNIYIRVLFLALLWQHKKLPTHKDNFEAASLLLETCLNILDQMCQRFQPPYSLSIKLYFPQILAYCLYTATCLNSPIKEKFLSKAKNLAKLPYTHDNFYFIVSSLRMLIQHCPADEIKTYAPCLENLLHETAAEPLEQHQIFDLAIQVAGKTKDRKKVHELLEQKAALFEKEAAQATSIMQEIYLLKKAAHIYVNLPQCHEKWTRLIQEIEIKSPRILDSLASIPCEYKINKELILQSEQNVCGKSFRESLKEVAACILQMPCKQDIDSSLSKNSILADIIPANVIDEKGFTSSIIDGKKNAHSFMFYTMLKWYWSYLCLHHLNPMLSRIYQEHFFTVQDLVPFCLNNPFVPPGREIIFAEGLYYFLKRDLIVSSSLWIPQLENSFRHILYGIEHITKIYADGRQTYKTEMGWFLNTLLEKKKITNKIHFNLTTLLCDEYFNIRNNLAHGLSSSNELYDPSVFILNWFIFYFVCYPALCYEEIKTQEENAKIN